MRLRPAVATIALLALSLAPAFALAQPAPQAEACRAPVVAVQHPPRPFDAGSTTNLLMAIENPNGPPVDSVRATVTTTAPAGWTAVPTQRELTLGPKNVSVSTIAVTAPNRGSGAGEGNVTVHVTFVCTSGEIQTSSSAAEVLQVSLRAFEAPWPLVLGAFGVLAGGVVVLGLRRLRRGTGITVARPDRDVEPGHSVKFTFSVDNRRGRPQRHLLVAEGVPEGWSLHLALRDVELEPGEEKSLWAILKAPPSVAPGTEASIVLRLLGERGTEAATAVLRVRVVAP